MNAAGWLADDAPVGLRLVVVATAFALASIGVLTVVILATRNQGDVGAFDRGLAERVLDEVGRGKLQRLVVSQPTRSRTIALATGREGFVRQTFDVVSDEKHERYRLRVYEDGRLLYGEIGSFCPLERLAEGRSLCDPPAGPVGFGDAFRYRLRHGEIRRLRAGRLGGRRVVWIDFDRVLAGQQLVDRVALEARTLRPLVGLDVVTGQVTGSFTILRLRNRPVGNRALPAGSGRFGVYGGAGPAEEELRARGLAAARRALRRVLWAGPSFDGRSLSVQVGRERAEGRNGAGESAAFARLRYGDGLTVDEFDLAGSRRLRQIETYLLLPPEGSLVLDPPTRARAWEARLRRHGLYVRIRSQRRADAIALARRLRPVR